MKLFDAISKSPVSAAFRYIDIAGRPTDYDDVNFVLVDGPTTKAFLALGNVAWIRKKLQAAKRFDDWRPAKTRDAPELEAPDVVTRLGDVSG